MRRSASIGTACWLIMVATVAGQRARPFEIADNSLLVEEAFNQEAGVFQNIFLFQKGRSSGPWSVEFTQEWPVVSQLHQFSYTVPFDFDSGRLGDIMLNYRLQARMEDESGPAFSPRLSVVLPTGEDESLDYGLQGNLPLSKQFGDLYVHGNAGATYTRNELFSQNVNLLSSHLSGSLIWRMLPMVHPLVEVVSKWDQGFKCATCGKERENGVVISPGFRAARNLGDHQLVLGAAVPFTASGVETDARVLVYLSYELPFKRP